MEELDELIPHPDVEGRLDVTHRAWVELDNVLWTFGRELKYLNASFNNIEFLPPEVGDLMLLVELDVSCNKLSELPPEIGKLTRLKKIKANGNYIRHVPAELGSCLMLEEVYLSENKLEELPMSLSKLQGLRVLSLQNNNLLTLPCELGVMPTISVLDCTGNNNLEMIPPSLRGDTKMVVWICHLHKEYRDEIAMLERLNTALEGKTQRVEEQRLRLKEEMEHLEFEKRRLLKERPAAYLAAKRKVVHAAGSCCVLC